MPGDRRPVPARGCPAMAVPREPTKPGRAIGPPPPANPACCSPGAAVAGAHHRQPRVAALTSACQPCRRPVAAARPASPVWPRPNGWPAVHVPALAVHASVARPGRRCRTTQADRAAMRYPVTTRPRVGRPGADRWQRPALLLRRPGRLRTRRRRYPAGRHRLVLHRQRFLGRCSLERRSARRCRRSWSTGRTLVRRPAAASQQGAPRGQPTVRGGRTSGQRS